jgi:hypothetical protein
MLRRRRRDGFDDDLGYQGVMDEIKHEKRRSRPTTRVNRLRPRATWRGFAFALIVVLGGLALFIGSVLNESGARGRIDRMEAATRCATVLPAKSTDTPSNYPACAVWVTTQVFNLDIPQKGTADLTLEDDSGGDWDLYYDNPPNLVRGLQDEQTVKMLVWQGDAVAVGVNTTSYALDDASPQDSAAIALGMIFLSIGLLLMSGTGLYSNIDRRIHSDDRRRRIGVTPMVVINGCVAIPCVVGGLVIAGTAPDSFGALIFTASFAFALACLFGWLLIRQRIRRRAGLPA